MIIATEVTKTSTRELPSAGALALTAAAMTLPTLAAVVYFLLLDGHRVASLVYVGTKIAQFSLPLLALILIRDLRPGRSSGESYRSKPVRWSLAKSVLVGLGAGLLLVVASLACYRLLAHSLVLAVVRDQVSEKLVDFGTTSPTSYLAFSMFLSLAHSGLEEYYWRWFVFGALSRWMSSKGALILSSLAFMSHHVVIVSQYVLPSGNYLWWILASGSVAFAGGLWCWLYSRSGRLIGPWISHAAADLVVLWIGYDLVFRS